MIGEELLGRSGAEQRELSDASARACIQFTLPRSGIDFAVVCQIMR